MATNIDHPWIARRIAYNSNEFYEVDRNGSSYEVAVDDRSPLVKTEKTGRFRPPTPYSRTISSGNQRLCPVTCYQTYKEGKYTYEQWFTGNTNCHQPSGLPVVPSSVTDWCNNRCLEKLKAQRVNLSQAFGERKQTVNLVYGNLVKVAKTGRALRKLDFDGALKALGLKRGKRHRGTNSKIRFEGITDAWLELQYGWKPLLSDIHGAMTALNERESRSNMYTACVTKARTEKRRFTTGNLRKYPFCDTGENNFSGSFWYRHDYTETYQAYIRYDYVRDTGIPVDALSRLGFTNPLSLAWELLPFSFVVDWTLPIGDYFNLLDASVGWNFRSGTVSTKAVRKSKHLVTDIFYQGRTAESGYATGKGVGRVVNFDRIVVSSPPSVRMPSVDTRASNLHIANGLALVSSAFLAKSLKVK